MHSTAFHLAPVFAAEKSRVPFYIAGGVLVAWALIVSVGLGLRRPNFPGHIGGERLVIAISAVLVLAAVASAVLTSSVPPKAGAAARFLPQISGGGGTSTVKLEANPGGQLSYDAKRLSAKAGKLTIAFTNASTLEHNVTVAQGGTVLGSTPTFVSGSRSLSLSLKPGSYTFYCSVPGHRQAGMEGTLSVS
jgi:plastocyanin